MIGNGGRKSRYTKEMKEDFSGVVGDHKISHFTSAIYQAYPYLQAEIDGLDVMWRGLKSCSGHLNGAAW